MKYFENCATLDDMKKAYRRGDEGSHKEATK